MYSRKHHWAYLCGTTPIFVSDHISRVATPADIQMITRCARILIYERIHPSNRLPGKLDGPTSHGATTAAPKSDSVTLIPLTARSDLANTPKVPTATVPSISTEEDQQESPLVSVVHLRRSDTRLVKYGSGEQARRGMRSTAVKSRKSLQVIPNGRQKVQISISGERPKPQQRVLGDFFGTLPPIMAAQSPVSNKGSNESVSTPNTAHSLTAEGS